METRAPKIDHAPSPSSAGLSERRRLRVRTAMGLLLCSALMLGSARAGGENDDDGEYRLKLAFIYNFAQFTQWPPEAFRDPAAPLTVCVVGQDPFAGEMEQTLHGRRAAGHPVEIKRLKLEDDPKGCHMIFVRANEKRAAGKILSAVRGSNTLTVGESRGFAELGGVINLVLDDNKLRFEVNLNAATQSRLRISSKVLALAKIVSTERTP